MGEAQRNDRELLGQIVQMTPIFITVTIEFESFEVAETLLYVRFTLRSKRCICWTSEESTCDLPRVDRNRRCTNAREHRWTLALFDN